LETDTVSFKVEALDHLVINVSDVETSVAWYERTLGMTREDFNPGNALSVRTALKFGRQKINLRPIHISKEEWFTADHGTVGSEDLCFLTDSQPDEVVRHLRTCEIEVEVGPVKKNGARGVLDSVYCRDPDGNLIEISSYAK
jgi:catechol 2,3-dioxygenase-like lactoylglutathione lyase family enzyme